MNKFIIIPRWECYTARDKSKQWAPMLMLYNMEQPRGYRLACYSESEGHSNASLAYYRQRTKPAKPDDAAYTLAAQYAKGLCQGLNAPAYISKRLPGGAW
jgi:hypothetical protein